MLDSFLSSLNYKAVIASGAAYWIFGALWFSVLFGNIWGSELEKHGVKIQKPTTQAMIKKLVLTFIFNLVVAFGVSFIVFATNSTTLLSAVKYGIFTGVCFSATTLGNAYTWEGKSLKLLLIDASYAVVGTTICAIILSLWK